MNYILDKKNKDLKKILFDNNLSITNAREIILDLFIKTKSALSNSDIEKKTKKLDRITIYRTLQVFLKKGIIHTIPSTDDVIMYAYCLHNCSELKHNDNHLHFSCIKCKKTICIDNVEIPKIKISKSFIIQEIKVIAKGICNNCNV